MSGEIINIIGSILDPNDTSKNVSMNLSSSSSGTTNTISFSSTANRVYSVPDATTTLVGADTSQTITNKTIDGTLNTLLNISASSSIVSGSVTNSLLQNMPSLTLKGNNTLSSSSPIDLTSAQATSILDTFSSSLKGLVPSSGGGTVNFLRADGTWVTPTATAAAGGSNTNIQYNNSGSLAGSNAFNFIAGANPVVRINGTPATTQLSIGGTTSPGTSTAYIEVATPGFPVEGLRCYFNRSTPGFNGWISYDYDGNSPNIRLTDEDDDPPYIQFNTIGSGSYNSPQFSNIFGGGYTGSDDGFNWKISGTEISTMNTQFFIPPSGTTAQRPSPSNGMFRYNTTLNRPEMRVPSVWVPLSGVIDKSTITQTVTGASLTNLINYTVPGGTLSTDGILIIKSGGIWNNPSGGGKTITLRIAYGGTTIWQSTSSSLSPALTIPWNANLCLTSNNSATSQTLSGLIMLGSQTATVGVGSLATDEIAAATPIAGTVSINSSVDQPLVFSVTLSTAGSTWTKYFHTIELL
jgi:hypothetical protein